MFASAVCSVSLGSIDGGADSPLSTPFIDGYYCGTYIGLRFDIAREWIGIRGWVEDVGPFESGE